MIRKRTLSKAALALALLTTIPTAYAVDSASFEVGRGNESTDLWRIGLQWDWKKHWLEDRPWRLGAYWDLQLGRWDAPIDRNGGERKELWDLGLTPVFRLQRAAAGAIVPYVEAAIGFHMISDERISFRRSFSTHFQFGDHLGAGVRFGPHGQYDASVRLQHLSNGGIRNPNPGINFLEFRLMLHFR